MMFLSLLPTAYGSGRVDRVPLQDAICECKTGVSSVS